jgi:putative Holliday junction resolvase
LAVKIALDWGKARIGVAACDKDGILAFPVATVSNDGQALAHIGQIIAEYQPAEIILGLPVALSGRNEQAAQDMQAVAGRLRAAFTAIPVRLVDERMSSAAASRKLRQAGHDSRAQRRMIDQAAAVDILEQVLAAERSEHG